MVLNVTIVGAGIGGPAAAIGLAQKGHKVTIFEQAKSQGEVGYSLRLTPNADVCLQSLGIDAESGGAYAANTSLRFDANGNNLDEISKENSDKAKGKSVFAYRPELVDQLMKRCRQLDVVVCNGEAIVDVDVERTEVVTSSGERVASDLIIAADGVRSLIRPHIVDVKKFQPKDSSHQEALRFMLDRSAVLNDPTMKDVIKEDVPMFSWVGNDKGILIYPVDFGKQFNFTCLYPSELREAKDKSNPDLLSYNHKLSQQTALEIYSDFPKEARRLIELADPNGFRVWKLVDMDEIGSWHRNQTVLMGDACHPVLPSSFSGASMAIEDGVTLAELFPEDVNPGDDLSSRLQWYQDLRTDRVDRVRKAGRYNAQLKENDESVKYRQEYMKFLASHDAVQHAREGLAKRLAETKA